MKYLSRINYFLSSFFHPGFNDLTSKLGPVVLASNKLSVSHSGGEEGSFPMFQKSTSHPKNLLIRDMQASAARRAQQPPPCNPPHRETGARIPWHQGRPRPGQRHWARPRPRPKDKARSRGHATLLVPPVQLLSPV